jgi:hypothetical protein
MDGAQISLLFSIDGVTLNQAVNRPVRLIKLAATGVNLIALAGAGISKWKNRSLESIVNSAYYLSATF